MSDEEPNSPAQAAESEKSLLLERLFSPIVLDARERLRQQTDAKHHRLLTANAHAGWEAYLLKRLSCAGRKVIDQQFRTFFSARSAFPGSSKNQRLSKNAAYLEFTGEQPVGRLYKILGEFPGLARICDVLTANWISAVREFLGRLSRDLAGFLHHFEGGAFPCPIHELQAGLSDPHRGGRCVVQVRFPGSASLLYKPRSVEPEACFASLLGEFNTEGPLHEFRSARCWAREGYGWMEEVVPEPCKEPAGFHAFYWRSGALLALIYLLRGVDMHQGNLVAVGDHPMLIDLETLWHPQEHVGAGDDPRAQTVLRTGFLPQIDPLVGAIYERSALGRRLASDAQGAHHLPTFAGTAYPAPPFLPDILAGFRWIGGQVFEQRRTRSNFQPWVQALAQCRRRRVLRSTSWYQAIIERMITPPSLRKATSFFAEVLNDCQDDPPLTEEERRSLLQLDVPYVEQPTGHDAEPKNLLPVQNIEDFLEQKTFVVDALAPAANGSSL